MRSVFHVLTREQHRLGDLSPDVDGLAGCEYTMKDILILFEVKLIFYGECFSPQMALPFKVI